MTLLGIDVGTTHCKAALFSADGHALAQAAQSMRTAYSAAGHPHYEPDVLWVTVCSVLRAVLAGADGAQPEAVGVSSMAEAGLLVDAESGSPRSPILPWYDTRASEQANRISRAEEPLDFFRRSGLYPSFKYGLPKILWLLDHDPDVVDGARWLSVADYVVYRLTGRMATDPTLAVRTAAYRLLEQTWDEHWIRRFNLDPDLFPDVLPSGQPAGETSTEVFHLTGLAAGTPAAVAGHDHTCALLAAGVTVPGPVLDSTGTAESLLGVTVELESIDRAYDCGLSLAPHIIPGRFVWLGGLSASGGSIEWLRTQLGEPALAYDEVMELLAQAGERPTGILYFPYLSGSGAPCHDNNVRGAFIGLRQTHRRADLLKAILEGTAYEIEAMRRAAEDLLGSTIGDIIVVGGATHNPYWLQIKGDVTGRRHLVPELPDAAVWGAALAAALGSGICDLESIEQIACRQRVAGETILPDEDRHELYHTLFEQGYAPLRQPLRQFGQVTARLHIEA